MQQQGLGDKFLHEHKNAFSVVMWQLQKHVLIFFVLFTLASIGLLIHRVHRHHMPKKAQMERIPQKESLKVTPGDISPTKIKDVTSSSRNLTVKRASLLQQPIEDGVTTNKNSGNPILSKLKHFLRIEDPIPIEAKGISLYALWKSSHILIKPSMEVSEGIGARMRTIGLWKVVHFIWLDTPAVTAAEAKDIVKALCHRLDELYPETPPTYLIFHIDKLSAPKPRFSLSFMKKVKTDIENAIFDAKEVFVGDIQLLCDLGQGQLTNGWLPNRFRHYDPETQQRGWLVISPRRALLIDVSHEQPLLLANLLQPYDTDASHGSGILPERYRELLILVMQWVSNQDSFQAVNQIKDLVESNTKAIDGQVLLNFAVAGIAILIAFLLAPGQTYSAQLTASVGCLAVASLWFWLYARSSRVFFQIIGWVFVLAIIPCFLAWSHLVLLVQEAVKFFSHL